MEIKDPDRWRPKDYCLLTGGCSFFVGILLFLGFGMHGEGMPRAKMAADFWNQLRAQGTFGMTGPILLGIGVILLLIGTVMRVDR